MELQEYYVKKILKKAGLPVLNGEVAYTPEEAQEFALKTGKGSFWLKPQIMGATLPYTQDELQEKYKAFSPQEVEQKSAQIFGNSLYAINPNASSIIQRIYVEQATDETSLFSMVIRVNFENSNVTFSVKNNKEELASFYLTEFKLDNLVKKKILQHLNIRNPLLKKSANIILEKAFKLFTRYEMMALEFGPIVKDKNTLTIVNARLIFDPDSLFKYPELVQCREIKIGHEREALAKKNSFRYTGLGGNIACLTNGIGLGWATIDALQTNKQKVACLLDVGTVPNVKSITTALRLALSEPNVDALFVNIYGGLTNCEDIAQGVLEASSEIPVGIPVIIRMAGLNEEKAQKLLSKSALPFWTTSKMKVAVNELIRLMKEKA